MTSILKSSYGLAKTLPHFPLHNVNECVSLGLGHPHESLLSAGGKSYLIFSPQEMTQKSGIQFGAGGEHFYLIYGRRKRVKHSIKSLARFLFKPKGKNLGQVYPLGSQPWQAHSYKGIKGLVFHCPVAWVVSFGAHVTRVAPKAILFSPKWLTLINCFARNSPKRPYSRSSHNIVSLNAITVIRCCRNLTPVYVNYVPYFYLRMQEEKL